MKKIIALLAALLATSAFAQSNPNLFNGQQPTAADWNGYFSSKLDYQTNGLYPNILGVGASLQVGGISQGWVLGNCGAGLSCFWPTGVSLVESTAALTSDGVDTIVNATNASGVTVLSTGGVPQLEVKRGIGTTITSYVLVQGSTNVGQPIITTGSTIATADVGLNVSSRGIGTLFLGTQGGASPQVQVLNNSAGTTTNAITLQGGASGPATIGTSQQGLNIIPQSGVVVEGDNIAISHSGVTPTLGTTFDRGTLFMQANTHAGFASAPGAAWGQLAMVCGTNSGTLKLVALAGTDGTLYTVLDNIGAGVTGC